jgi:hypothetical protein
MQGPSVVSLVELVPKLIVKTALLGACWARPRHGPFQVGDGGYYRRHVDRAHLDYDLAGWLWFPAISQPDRDIVT